MEIVNTNIRRLYSELASTYLGVQFHITCNNLHQLLGLNYGVYYIINIFTVKNGILVTLYVIYHIQTKVDKDYHITHEYRWLNEHYSLIDINITDYIHKVIDSI